MAHDISYRYGFDEASGNFQSLNYGQAGRGGDPVLALGQSDGNALVPINNAFMATPPDGFQPLMVMGEFNVDFTSPAGHFIHPRRDTSLVSDVVLHEFFHGVSNRLTGGPANAGALNAQQSGSMGEGWSDFFAIWAVQRPTDLPATPIESGVYLTGPAPAIPGKGIRRFPYSFDLSVNPLMFSDFNNGGGANCDTATSNCEVHNAGEIWASMLWDLNWILQAKYGFDPDIFAGKGGNNLAMRLVIEGLKLQPSNFQRLPRLAMRFSKPTSFSIAASITKKSGLHSLAVAWVCNPTQMPWTWACNLASTRRSSSSIRRIRRSCVPPLIFPNNPGKIRGKVFNDANGNGVFDAQETGIGGVTMFLDVDNDGIFDPLEPTTTTAADGTYEFEIFVRGDFRVGQIVPPGLQQTTPAGIGGQTVTRDQRSNC